MFLISRPSKISYFDIDGSEKTIICKFTENNMWEFQETENSQKEIIKQEEVKEEETKKKENEHIQEKERSLLDMNPRQKRKHLYHIYKTACRMLKQPIKIKWKEANSKDLPGYIRSISHINHKTGDPFITKIQEDFEIETFDVGLCLDWLENHDCKICSQLITDDS